MKNLSKKHQSKKEITASKLEHVKMSLRIVWSKSIGLFSLKKSAQVKFQKNLILLMLIIHMIFQ